MQVQCQAGHVNTKSLICLYAGECDRHVHSQPSNVKTKSMCFLFSLLAAVVDRYGCSLYRRHSYNIVHCLQIKAPLTLDP